jgi:hypothetical protein
MPYYDYKCNTCDVEEEVTHDMILLEEMSDKQVDKLRCKNKDCANYGEIMSRVYKAPTLGGSSGGTMMSEKQLMHKKQGERKLRSKKHFKREVLPDLNETPKIMDHFEKKFKDI